MIRLDRQCGKQWLSTREISWLENGWWLLGARDSWAATWSRNCAGRDAARYGPRDSFDPSKSHVIPALIKKCLDAVATGAPRVVVWGSGSASREFLFVEDCARAVVLATQRYDKPEPVNLGAGIEIRIRDLAAQIARLTGFKGEIVWDTDKPDGQPRRCLEVSRAEREFGFIASTEFETGPRRTIEWYRNQSATMAAS